MKKSVLFRIVFVSAFAALWLLYPSALAADVDVDYQGDLDTVTGEAVYSDEDTGVDQSDRVQVSDDVIYDRNRLAYVYTVGDMELATSIVDGMIIRGKATIVPDDTLSVVLYRNGEEVTDENLDSISETGQYVLEATTNGQSQRIMAFSIVGEYANSVDSYTMPSGFVITGASRNGTEISWQRNYVDMSTEGEYIVEYTCSRAGMSYQLNIVVDHTAPELNFDGIDADNCARGPVTLLDAEEDATITIKHGDDWGGYQEKLTESGDYQVRITDRAGNSTDYYFTILIYFDSNSFVFIGLILAVIAGTVAYVFLFRKKMRVR